MFLLPYKSTSDQSFANFFFSVPECGRGFFQVFWNGCETTPRNRASDSAAHHRPPTTRNNSQIKLKVFEVQSVILLRYKRIKRTPNGEASLLSSQGDKF